jgi:hypothetical protein
LRAIWQRGHARDDTPEVIANARMAFAQACHDVDPDEIIGGAKTWFAAFEAGDGARYLPQLSGWLAAHGWEKPPPKKRGRTHGNGKASHNGYAKPDMFKICLKEGGYREDPETGEMYWPDPNSGAGEDDEPFGTSMWGSGR